MNRSLWLSIAMLVLLAACTTPSSPNLASETIQREMGQAVEESKKAQQSDLVNAALLPPLSLAMPKIDNKSLDSKFDLSVSNTPASQVFMAIVSGTRYSMLLHPDVSGNISLHLKDVSVFEALETIRELYGYDYKVDGARIYIQSVALQTRIYQVNYLSGLRAGTSSLRVTSGSVGDNVGASTGAAGGAGGQGAMGINRIEFAKNKPSNQGSSASISNESGKDGSKVMTVTSTDFWGELDTALHTIVGEEKGRSVVISPSSGVIVIRAMPDELKNVAAYLKAAQIAVERQVILEAKIVEVQLSDGYQSGVNWGGFKTGPNSAVSAGQLGANGLLAHGVGAPAGLIPSPLNSGGALTATAGQTLANTANVTGAAGSLFGLAFQTSNFAALLNFLESQGNVHVLSSPRIATLNNQKAVLKVGTDEFFVTEVSGGTPATTTVAGTAPTVKVQPFFSGIALDVTPRIDENGEIILHVHPSVSSVTTVNKTLNLGTANGAYNLPLASSSVSETDSIVRAHDGQIVAIGGLMRQATYDDRSGLPGLPKGLFGQTNQRSEKRELVILLKPSVVDSGKDWSDDITRSRDRLNGLAVKEPSQ
ncbi:MAG: secretin N-terminal domain-containing protein [Sideroxydans sp.]|nr:secretin N-terminal domain-containing protein [Sideroxydans sp.]